MQTPDWIYKRLPQIYLGAGAATLALAGFKGMAALSAIMFFGAGWLVAYWRRQARPAAQKPVARHSARRRT